MKKILLLLWVVFISNFANAAQYPEVSCSWFWSNASWCNQCFDWGWMYVWVWRIWLYDDFINSSSLRKVMFKDDRGSVSFQTLQTGTTWYHSNNLYKFPDSFVFYTAKNGRNYHIFEPNRTEKFLESQTGYWIRLESVTGSVVRTVPSYKITYEIKTQELISNWVLNPKVDVHKECAFFYPNWCWDWVRDTRETCDPNDPTHTWWGPGWCSTATCTPILATCNPGTTTWVRSTPVTATTPWLCQSWAVVWNFGSTVSGTTTNYVWSCNWSAVGWACSASYSTWGWSSSGWSSGWSSGGSSGWSSGWSSGGWSNYCWDWVVQRPNSSWFFEECDPERWFQNLKNPDWTAKYPWCNSSCTTWTFTNPWNGWWSITNPGSYAPWDIYIRTQPGSAAWWSTNPGTQDVKLSDYKVIVWNWVNVFSPSDEILFKANYTVYLSWDEKVCINETSDVISSANSSLCKNIRSGWLMWTLSGQKPIVYNGSSSSNPTSIELFDYNELKNYKWNTSSLVGGLFTKDTNWDFSASIDYLKSLINVRVAKPAVSNSAWWWNYLAKPLGYSVDSISDNFLNNLKQWNFTSVVVNSNNAQFGYWQNLTSNIAKNVKNDVNSTTSNSLNLQNISKVTDNTQDFDYFYSVNKTKITMESQIWLDINTPLTITWVKTVIINNWDLNIKSDIKYWDKDASWAFIVKNWNINIAANVKNIAWVYVVLDENSWVYSMYWESTANQLMVDWSIYWNMQNLVNNRTYIRGQTTSTSLSTWVIVNYSNRSIKNPPPLLKSYLKQFSLKRIAK